MMLSISMGLQMEALELWKRFDCCANALRPVISDATIVEFECAGLTFFVATPQSFADR